MTCGIYLLGFNNTEKVYVGQSKNIETRYTVHINELRKGTHTKKMNLAYNTYGIPDLEIIKECSKEELDTIEIYHIKLWDAVKNGFNYLEVPRGGASKGETNNKAKYFDEDIIKLVEYITDNPTEPLVKVASTLNMGYATVKNVAEAKTYRWLNEVIPEAYSKLLVLLGTRSNQGERQGAAKFTNDQVYAAFKMLLEDITVPNKDIANKCGITESCVVAICTIDKYTWLQEKYPEEHAILMSKLADKRAYSRSAKARGIVYPPIKSPIDGSINYIDNVNKFAKSNGLDTGSLNKLLNGKANSTKGWVLFKEEKMPA